MADQSHLSQCHLIQANIMKTARYKISLTMSRFREIMNLKVVSKHCQPTKADVPALEFRNFYESFSPAIHLFPSPGFRGQLYKTTFFDFTRPPLARFNGNLFQLIVPQSFRTITAMFHFTDLPKLNLRMNKTRIFLCCVRAYLMPSSGKMLGH